MSPSEFREYVKPGTMIWFIADQGKGPEQYGVDGDMVYQGYQVIGTVTFLVFDHVKGSGKKMKRQTLSINALDVKRLGRIESQIVY